MLAFRPDTPGLADSRPESEAVSHFALTAAPVQQQTLTDLGPRGRSDSLYFLLMNALAPVFLPQVLHYWQFWLFTFLAIVFNTAKFVYLRQWTTEVAAQPKRAGRIFKLLKCGQNATLSALIGWMYLTFGISQLVLLSTVVLIAFAQATTITLRPNVRIMRLTLCCCLIPAAAAAIWTGGGVGYGTALVLVVEMIFLWRQGQRENREYLYSLQQNRELVRSRWRANKEGARIGDALLTNAARHTATIAERNRIAYEWHDVLLAGFSAISWQLDEAIRCHREAPARAWEAVEVAQGMVHHYRTEARIVISEILHGKGEDEELADLIRRELPKIVGSAPVDLRIDIRGTPVRLSSDIRRQLFKICQQAVSNAARHANARRINVFVGYGTGQIEMSVSDDGCRNSDRFTKIGHFGIQNMKERVRRVGGDLRVERSAGCNTAIIVSVPYSADFNMTPTRIVIVEDQYFSRLALHTIIDGHADMKIVSEADTAQAGIEAFRRHAPDVTIVDLKLPDHSGIEVIKEIRRTDPMARIVVLSNFEGSEHLYRATEAGAMAYLTKDSNADELLEAIRTVRTGQSFIPPSLLSLLEGRVSGNDLTVREQRVLELLVLGWSNKQIGEHLGIAEKTVRIHMSNIFSKLGAVNRTQAVLIALQRGFVDPQPKDQLEQQSEQASRAVV